ncbi:hypothetical protein H1C71_038333, partial [Ictidomys tridecemlineatus]
MLSQKLSLYKCRNKIPESLQANPLKGLPFHCDESHQRKRWSTLPARTSATFMETQEPRLDTIFESSEEKKIHARNENNFYEVRPPPAILTCYQLCLQVRGR